MLELLVEPEAEEELAEAIDWYDTQEPGLGAALMGELDRIIGGLRREALRGVGVPGVREDLRVRRILLKRFPYAVVFISQDEIVHVIAFAHQGRRPGYWRDRLG